MRFNVLYIVFFISTIGFAQHRLDRNPNTYKFKYKNEVFKGSRGQITEQLRNIKNREDFKGIPFEMRQILNKLFKKATEQPIRKKYKEQALVFLEALYGYEEFVKLYHNKLSIAIMNLKKDMKRLDFKFEREFTKAKIALDRAKKEDIYSFDEIEIMNLSDDFEKSQLKLISHRWMKKKFDSYDNTILQSPDEYVSDFRTSEAMHVYKMYQDKKISKIDGYLVNQIIEFYHTTALIEMDLEQLDLNYITKL